MVKRYADLSFFYAIIAMISGVFYREFTKLLHFTGDTRLSVMHTHYFLLGMVFFLLLMLLEKSFHFSAAGRTKTVLLLYNIGLNITGFSFLIRGLTQVWSTGLSRGADASLSGIAGIGHILLGIGIILLLLQLRKQTAKLSDS